MRMAVHTQRHGLSQVGGYGDDPVASGPFGGHATLSNGLVSAWKFDEESGTRVDAHGTNNLTDNNTVGFAAGMNGNAASFVAANSESLTSAVQWDGTAAWSVATWSYPIGDQTAYASLFGADSGAAGFGFYLRGDGGIGSTSAYFRGLPASRVITLAMTNDAWHFVYFELTAGGVPGVSIDNAALTTAGAFTYSPSTTTGLGKTTAGTFYNGYIDAPLIYSRVLTAQERTDLYNGGAGLFY